ncbi:MAG: LamG domain-containing protein, partial [Anaerolineae bacterium]
MMVTRFLAVSVLAVGLVSMVGFVPSKTQHVSAESQLPASVALSGSDPMVPASRGIPLVFIENVGQFDERIHFQARSGTTTLFLTNDALWLSLTELSSKPDPISEVEVPGAVGTENVAGRGVNLRLSFVGANARPRLEPFDERDVQLSFFTGSDPDQWQTHVPAWGGVRYVELYPGVDLEITSQDGQLAPRLVVREPSSLQGVRLRVEGVDDLALEGNYLHLNTPLGDLALPLVTVEGSRPDAQPSILNVGRGTFQVSSPFASAPMSADVSTQDLAPSLRDGLLVYYSFDTDEGGIVTDESGSGNDGTVVGTPTYTTQGRFGGAYYFAAESGSGCCSWYRDYVVLNGNPTANLEQFAVSLWLKTDHPEFNYKIASAADWPPGSGWVVGTQYPEAWSDDGNSIRYGSRTRSVDLIAGTWNHMAVSYDGITFKEYINGQLSREWPTTGLPLGDANGQVLAVAAWPQHGFGYDGLIDELRIYSRALSADEVSRLYDPDWSYSTYLGGSCEDRGYDIAVDNTGN